MALHDRELHARNNDEHVRPVDVLSRVLAQKYKIMKGRMCQFASYETQFNVHLKTIKICPKT